jgi:hypothetical protein
LALIDLDPSWLIGEQNQASGEAKAQPDNRNQSNWSHPPHLALHSRGKPLQKVKPKGRQAMTGLEVILLDVGVFMLNPVVAVPSCCSSD